MLSYKKTVLFFLPFIPFMLILQGCAAPGVRPEDANIFQAAGNLGKGGEFERQTAQKRFEVLQSEQELAQAQARFDTLRRTSASLQQQKQQLDREYWQITQKNIALEKSIQQLRVKKSNNKRKQKIAQNKLNKIKKKTKALKSQRTSISTKEYKKRIAILNSDIIALENEYLAD